MNTQFQLDPLGRLKQQIAQPSSHNKADPAVLIGRRYQYDTIGNLVRTDDQTNGSRDYTYDALGRITQSADEHYRYDPAHNLTDGSRISGNRLTQYKGISYRYDPLGNLIEKQHNNGEIQHYRYNADNQLTEAEIHRPGQNAVLYRYRYDPIGRRIAKVHPDGSEIQYLWDGSRLLQEYRKDRTYTYVYTEDRNYEPLAQIITYNGSDKAREILYYHNDQIGIPREMTDEEGNIVWSGDYSGWGKLTQEGRLKMDIHQPFRLQNQHYDEETGLHYNFFRYYDPEIGRFTQQDPIKLLGGESLYAFAPNVFVWLDTLGLAKYNCIADEKEGGGGRGYRDGRKLCTYSCTNVATKKTFSVLSNSDIIVEGSHFCRGADVENTVSLTGNLVPHHKGYKPFIIDTDGLGGWWDSKGRTQDIHDQLKKRE